MEIDLENVVVLICNITETDDPLLALNLLIDKCVKDIHECWLPWIFFRHLIVTGEILDDPGKKMFSLDEIEKLLDVVDLREFLTSMSKDDRVSDIIHQSSVRKDRQTIVWVGAIASLLIDKDYTLSFSDDKVVVGGARRCLGWFFGNIVKEDFLSTFY
jgi:hypothetical protein